MNINYFYIFFLDKIEIYTFLPQKIIMSGLLIKFSII